MSCYVTRDESHFQGVTHSPRLRRTEAENGGSRYVHVLRWSAGSRHAKESRKEVPAAVRWSLGHDADVVRAAPRPNPRPRRCFDDRSRREVHYHRQRSQSVRLPLGWKGLSFSFPEKEEYLTVWIHIFKLLTLSRHNTNMEKFITVK